MASNAAIEGASGAMGGIIALLATYPLMTLSTMQATRGKTTRVSQDIEQQNMTVPAKRRTGLSADIAEVISKHGWTGFYRGLEPALLGTAVSQGVYFYLYSRFRQLAVTRLQTQKQTKSEDIGVGASLLVAFLAGCGNVLLTTPIWTVTTRMQAQQKKAGGLPDPKKREGPVKTAQDIYEEGGVKALWNGCLPALIMVSNPTVQYVIYEWLVARLAEWRRSAAIAGDTVATKAGAGEFFLMSALAKLGATVLTYPILLVKQRLQAASKHTHADLKYSGTYDAVRTIWQKEGFLGFYDGMKAKIVQSVLAAALLMSIKEELTTTARLLLNGTPQPVAAAAEKIKGAAEIVQMNVAAAVQK
ncbi:hypothetical protein ABBQ32_011511 [Trebouxia sp. C0010 RCD-2024]